MAVSQPSVNPLLEAALGYAARGWPVFPLHSLAGPSRCDCGKANCGSNAAKHPWTKNGCRDATTDAQRIHEWWRRWPRANIGLATGVGDAPILVLDVDPRHGGDESLFELELHADQELPPTLESLTGGGGRHLLYTAGGLRNRTALAGWRGLDVRATGGYIVAPPSLHASGARYEWSNPGALPVGAPRWLIEIIARKPKTMDGDANPAPSVGDYSPSTNRWLDLALRSASEGNRNERGFWLACQLRDDGLALADAETTLCAYARQLPTGATPYTEAEALQSARSAYRQPRRDPARSQAAQVTRPISLTHEQTTADDDDPPRAHDTAGDPLDRPSEHRTDWGNARRFVRQHGANTRYVAAWDHWLLWDGTRFQHDTTNAVMRLAKATVTSIYGEAEQCDDHEERKELARWAMKSESEARLHAMVGLAESEPEVALAADAFDTHAWLLNTTNGVVDLQTGQRRPHDRALLCTKRANVAYLPETPCLRWLTFLHTIFAGDEELIDYVQRAVGYSLTTQVSEQCVFVCHGNGANGKSTFLDVLIRVLGDYAMTTPTDTLMVKTSQNIPSDVARLQGARFVSASESGDGRRLDEELIKRITGGDRMSARFMHKDWFDFWPVLKLWLAVNHEPAIRGTDNGIWRRIHLIPFSVTIPAERQDHTLGQKLFAEGAGILAWAVQGALMWQRDGLKPPAKVTQATAAYRARQDTLGAFFDEMCDFGWGHTVSNKALRGAYKAWCEDGGDKEASQQRFSAALLDRATAASPVTKERIPHDGGTLWRGVGLKSSPKQESF